jgi:hypothetical protein
MWTTKSLTSIREEKTLMGRPNLQLIADYGYQATLTLPMALYFEQVMEEYPDHLFTMRENSEVWFRLWDTHKHSMSPPIWTILPVFVALPPPKRLFSVVNIESYLTASFQASTQKTSCYC